MSRRAPVALAAGSVLSGVLAYVLFALLTRGLGAEAAAPVSVLWTLWAFASAALSFPLQHWITTRVVSGQEGDVRHSAMRVGSLVVAASVGLGLVAWLLRDDLFHRDDAWFPVLVVLVMLSCAAVGVVRGGLAGRGRFAAVGWSLVAENGIRCVLVALLLAADVREPEIHGLALVAGVLVAVWPSAWRFARGDAATGAFAFLGGAASGQLVAQVVLTGGPVLLALIGGSPVEVTTLFAALALFRAPYQIVLGVLPQVTERVTTYVVSGAVDQLRRLARGLTALTLVAVPAAGVFGAVAGPWILRFVFGDSIDVTAEVAALISAGSTLAIANVIVMVASLVGDRPLRVAGAWAVAVVAGTVVTVACAALSPVLRTSAVFFATEVVATVVLAVVAWRSLRLGRGARA